MIYRIKLFSRDPNTPENWHVLEDGPNDGTELTGYPVKHVLINVPSQSKYDSSRNMLYIEATGHLSLENGIATIS